MAGRGVISGGKSYQQLGPRNTGLGTLRPTSIDTPDTVQKAQPMDSLIPTVKGQDVPQPDTNWGSGKVTGPKGSSGVVRATTKSKKGW
jgi:hypothetical protein